LSHKVKFRKDYRKEQELFGFVLCLTKFKKLVLNDK